MRSQQVSGGTGCAPWAAALLLLGLLAARAPAQDALPGAPSAAARAPAVPGMDRTRALPQTVALATGLSGPATLRHAGRIRPLAVLQALAPGDELQLAPGTSAEIVVAGPRQRVYALSGAGRYRLHGDEIVALEPRATVVVRDLLGEWRTLRLQPGPVGRASVALRGADESTLATRVPVGGQCAASLEFLRWDAPRTPPFDHWTYTVRLVDEQGREVLAAQTVEPLLALPRDLDWHRGAAYVWTVDAASEGGRRAEGAAEFRLVDAAVEARVAAAMAAAAAARDRPPRAVPAAEDVLLALLLDQAGLRNEADRQWRRLAGASAAFAAWGALAR